MKRKRKPMTSLQVQGKILDKLVEIDRALWRMSYELEALKNKQPVYVPTNPAPWYVPPATCQPGSATDLLPPGMTICDVMKGSP